MEFKKKMNKDKLLKRKEIQDMKKGVAKTKYLIEHTYELLEAEYKTNIASTILQRNNWANINVNEFVWWFVDDSKERWGEEHMMGNLGFMPNDVVERLKKTGVKKDVVSEMMVSLYIAIAETTDKIWVYRCKTMFEKKNVGEEMIVDIP